MSGTWASPATPRCGARLLRLPCVVASNCGSQRLCHGLLGGTAAPPTPHPGQSSGGGRSRHTECALCCLHAAALLLTQHWHSRWLNIRPPPPSPARCQFGDYRGKWGLVHILLKTLKEKLGVIGPAEVGGPLPVLLLPAALLVVSSLLPSACWA